MLRTEFKKAWVDFCTERVKPEKHKMWVCDGIGCGWKDLSPNTPEKRGWGWSWHPPTAEQVGLSLSLCKQNHAVPPDALLYVMVAHTQKVAMQKKCSNTTKRYTILTLDAVCRGRRKLLMMARAFGT